MHARITHGHDERKITFGHGDRYLDKSADQQAGEGTEKGNDADSSQKNLSGSDQKPEDSGADS